ncbi:NH(3)-dependent NAD(+) synthetase [Candidatus Kryptonium thompsonii]|jgi:NAD+ synthase|uniref:NH(3)-dependent NAD(+) synthetase n=1 Tax=Candidatus Kryptonium thompsonii TaxID=1633631 RepID=A0A0P1NVG9_9BACT|nr:NAD+ synthase [Candidatus Kryptonium thompsoni]CUS80004.1 NH(3)-dependent NAD(+) synthetase [Candidatus Kryptonium thompsoni]CUS82562.1 NH(3)-dependent NAD(+) synthetase [Candidatus Kryptonium thompsoni]CUS84546.1 NH(3)-dependent NAD(+) synthetase [Candidatus Kryptonium thompsoni]CUS87805.1 NH(3)-dependent NAD(+) synthetase [Candidatus Kryptonium thompsoni]CUS89477.1 NH(3)-dependent NAD(+) synthetase [Candidatus Kryptonium thompsoni]
MEILGKAKDLKLNMKIVRKILVDFIRKETTRFGLKKGVIGVSGGVDSAVSAYLSAEALGPENVLGVIMPYKTSSPDSIEDAKLVISNLGIKSEFVDITPMCDPYFEKFPDMDRVRQGNVMARMRMIVLYDLSAREKALVIGTSNKTELLLGYGTLYGDMASAINPLGDLYKTQVWQLAEELGVPRKIIDKKPTADLWIGQTDEDELGLSYRVVDKLLYFMVDERKTDDELIELGFDKNMIERVKLMVQRNQFKRRPPIIAKISYRTINIDFRYARDWGS